MKSAALLGLGEVGRVLAEDLAVDRILAWDTAFGDASSRARRNAADLRLVPSADAASATAEAAVVFSAVTAANTLSAARSVAPRMTKNCWYVDLNSASPRAKVAAADVVERAGGRYVEAAVMSPIHPRRLSAPILLGGPHAADFVPVGSALGWTGLEVFSDRVGPAAATKLCRSVVVKGLEALVTEAMLTARSWGVEEPVLDSLSNVIPVDDWADFAAYLVSRSVEHGARRAEEMREAAATVADAGVSALMASATAERQQWAAQFGAEDGPAHDLRELLDRMRSAP
jgi:3-hydroxyisobutyrate dehydrogenase-like beta-hydroxyacid dehydrogenase